MSRDLVEIANAKLCIAHNLTEGRVTRSDIDGAIEAVKDALKALKAASTSMEFGAYRITEEPPEGTPLPFEDAAHAAMAGMQDIADGMGPDGSVSLETPDGRKTTIRSRK